MNAEVSVQSVESAQMRIDNEWGGQMVGRFTALEGGRETTLDRTVIFGHCGKYKALLVSISSPRFRPAVSLDAALVGLAASVGCGLPST